MRSHGLDASVAVNGVPLAEHGVTVEGTKHSCWIETSPGQEFTVEWVRTPEAPWREALAGYLFLDSLDKQVDGLGMWPGAHSSVHKGVRDTISTIKPFVFEEIASLASAFHCASCVSLTFLPVSRTGHDG